MVHALSCRQSAERAGQGSIISRAAALKFLWAWSLALLPATVSLAATDPWKNTKIMPRNDQAMLVVGGNYVGSVHDVSWPATVAKREGQWLWISDRSGYRRGAVEGWINIADVLKAADAQNYYSQQLQTAPTGALYWLRGITWESSGDKDVAQIDYKQAIDTDPSLVDANVRLGRLEADDGLPRAVWEVRFQRASELKPKSPQVHFSWAEALRAKFAASDHTSASSADEKVAAKPTDPKRTDSKQAAASEKFQCFCDADKMFARAKEYDPSWPYTHLGLGQLRLASAQATMKQKLHESTKLDIDKIRLDSTSKDQLDAATRKSVEDTLAIAISEFNEAIQWNPQAVDAYRDRGEAYRLQNKLSSAMRSADKACKMLDYRASYSLQVLAAVYYDSSGADHDADKIVTAITYATKAAQYAQGDKSRQFKQDLDFYVAQLSKQPNSTLVTPGAAIMDELPRRGNFDDTSSAAKQPGADRAPPPAPSERVSQGISEDAGKSSGGGAVADSSTSNSGASSGPAPAAAAAKRIYYAIPDLVPQPLSGIQE